MKKQHESRLVIAAPQCAKAKLEAIIEGMGIVPDAICLSGGEAMEAVQGSHALLLTTYQLPDMTGAELARELEGAADVLMIVPGDYEEDDCGALLLRNPISQEALHQAIRATQHMQEKLLAASARAAKAERQLIERKTIDKAKGRLMDELHLSEKEAHHRIQKRSMDLGKRIVDVANEILAAQTLTEEG